MNNRINTNNLYNFLMIFTIFYLLFNFSIGYAQQDFWEQTTGPEGGRLERLYIDGSGYLYTFSWNAGLFRSTDNGDSWLRVLFAGDILTPISAMMAQGSAIFITSNNNIYRSYDSGNNWQLLSHDLDLSNTYITAFAMNNSGAELYAGVRGGQIYRSYNDGINWSQLFDASGFYSEVTVNSIVINSLGNIYATIGEYWSGGAHYGVYRSTDGGASWGPANTGLPVLSATVLAVNNNDILFVGTHEDSLFRSTDNGDNWQPANNGIVTRGIYTVYTNPYNNEVYCGSYDGYFYQSSDSGNTWAVNNSGLMPAKNLKAITVNSSGDLFIASENNGIWRKRTTDADWLRANTGILASEVHAFAFNSANNYLFAATPADGVFRSDDEGWSWYKPSGTEPDNNPWVEDICFTAGYLFRTGGGNIYRSSDNGVSWETVYNGLSSYVFAINSLGYIYAGTDNNGATSLIKSMSLGSSGTWISLGTINDRIDCLSIDGSGRLYAATRDYDRGVYYSDNDGATWNPINSGLNNSDAKSILTLESNPYGQIYAGTIDGIYLYNNNQSSWVKIHNDARWVEGVAFNFLGHLFIEYDGNNGPAVSRSVDKGKTWDDLDSGIGSNQIKSLFSSPNGRLFAGTWGAGILRSTSYTVLPNPPGLNYPGNYYSDIQIQPNFSWNGVSGAGRYYLQIATDSQFDDANIVFKDTAITATSYNLVNFSLRYNVLYYWRVSAYSADDYAVSDWSGAWEFTTESYPAQIDIDFVLDFPTHDRPEEYASTDYRLFGIPGQSGISIADFLGNDNRDNWKVYWDNGGDNNYFQEFDGNAIFDCNTGRAFWIIYMGHLDTPQMTVNSAYLNNNQAEINVHSGWNLITNPFLVRVQRWEIEQVNSVSFTLWEYDGTFHTTDNFDPYKGYYFYNTMGMGSNLLRIPFPGTMTKIASDEPPDWQINLNLSVNNFKDDCNWIGVSKEAEADVNKYNFRKPRSIGFSPSINLKNLDSEGKTITLARDIRPEVGELETWDFEVCLPSKEEATLSFNDIKNVPDEYEVFLVDNERSIYLDLRDQPSFNFIPVKTTSHFKLLIGKPGSISQELNKILPTEFSLGENYPNPFNPSTTIPVSLVKPSEITLKIYDILGREVYTVFNGTRDIGTHYFLWDGTNYSGNNLSSGVYIYRLNIKNEGSFTRKMIMLK